MYGLYLNMTKVSLVTYFPFLYSTLPIVLQSFCTMFKLNFNLNFRLDNYKLKTVVTSSKELIQETGSQKLIAYSEFFSQIGSGDVVNTVNTILLFILNTLLQHNLSELIITQVLSLFNTICHNPHIQRIVIAMDSMKQLVVKHYTYNFASLSHLRNGRFITPFYSSLTEAMLICSLPGDLDHFVTPLLKQLNQSFQEGNMDRISFCLRATTGIIQSTNTYYYYNTVYDIL